MDYLLDDEIFDHENDELLQSPEMESELWQNDLINDLHSDNQFFNDQEFDINQFSLSFDEENKVQNKNHTNSNLFQVSPETFSRGVSPVKINVNDSGQLKPSMRTITVLHKRKTPLDYRESLEFNHGESKRCLYDDTLENSLTQGYENFVTRHKSAFKIGNTSGDHKLLTKFKKPDNISLIQVTPNTSLWGERMDLDRVKYSLSPSTNSPESAIDCSMSSNGTNHGSYNRDISFLSHSNNLQNGFYELKYKSQKDDSYSSKISHNNRLFQSPIPQTGVLILTEEEKRTLLLEGYQIPSRLPLTKHEERNLKKVRRKIKNKISAQESRRKKKEYMEALEKKVEIYAHENNDLRKKLENQETANKSLLGQLRHLQHMLGRASSSTTSTCVMVFILCFSLILVGMPNINQPMQLPQSMLVVRNIHKMGYGSLLRRESSQLTAMQKYFPPDIDDFVNMSFDPNENTTLLKESILFLGQNKGNEPFDSLESQPSGQRKSILLGNVREEEDECVQYGPRYLWWLLQSPTFNTDESTHTLGTSVVDSSDSTNPGDNILSTVTVVTKPRISNLSTVHNDVLHRSNLNNDIYEVAINSIAT